MSAATYNDGFSDGVLLALQIIVSAGNYGSADYEELVNCTGLDSLVKRAKNQGMLRLTRVGEYARSRAREQSGEQS